MMNHVTHITTVVVLLAALISGGCASTSRGGASAAVANRAADVAVSMVGIPYKFGGASPKTGFDCSGLVMYSYGRAGVQLPHANGHLIRATDRISRKNLQRGDLVFFNELGQRDSHVGIYLGNGQFVHSPSSGKKIYIADLENPYWQRSFSQARRVNGN